MVPEAHLCPKPGCTKTVPNSMLACAPHWKELPVELRARINIAWRGRKLPGGESRHLAAVTEAVQWWQADFYSKPLEPQ